MSRLVLTFGLAAMDTCWLFAWSLLIGLWSPATSGRPLLSAPGVFVLLMLAALTAQFFGRRHMSPARRAWFAALALVTVTFVVRIEHFPRGGAVDWIAPLVGALAVTIGELSEPVLAFAMGLYLWWRGIRLGSQTPSYVDVESGFRWGIGMLVTFGLISALSTRPSALAAIETQTTPFVIAFFFVSLVTLGLGRLESLRTRTRRLAVNTQWLSVLVLLSGVVVLAALVAAQVVSFDLLIVVTRPFFDLLGLLLTLVLYALVIPLAYAIQWLIYLILSLLRADPNRPPPQPLEPADIDNLLQRFFAERVPPELIFGLKAAGAVLLLGIGLLIVARAMSRWRPTSAEADAANEERDSLWSGASVRQRLLDWLRRLLRGSDSVSRLAEISPAVPEPDVSPRLASVRALYLQLLRMGAAAGATRSQATTPLEHLPQLARVLGPDSSLLELTDAYVKARYADIEASETETASLLARFDQIRPKAATAKAATD